MNEDSKCPVTGRANKPTAEIRGWYMLMGQYDEMCILEAPDAETVAKLVITLSAKYGGKTETLRAFSEEEAKKLCPSHG